MTDSAIPNRSHFKWLRAIPTRWMDNDHYGHVNNVAYYSYFDTAVNGFLIDATGIDIRELPAIGIVAESSCRFSSLARGTRSAATMAAGSMSTSTVPW